jgi:hypothetical protein
MTTNPTPHGDDLGEHLELLASIGAALDQIEPLPPHLVEVAYGARLMSEMEAELAELVFDSHSTEQPAMRNEAEVESRFLSFANDNLTVDLSLLPDNRTVVGEIDPVVASELVVEGPHATSVAVPIDEFGRFTITLDASSFKLRVAGYLVTPRITR